MHAPLKNKRTIDNPWEGEFNKKPWDYEITAVIPVLDTPDLLSICIDLLRYQTKKPFILVIDTGSDDHNLKIIESMRAEDVEVHSLRLNGVLHPSDFVAMAMDLAFTLCRTELMFCTHADCFLKKRDILETMAKQCRKYKAVGYEITPRAHEDWVGMISHTCTMLDMKTMDLIGAGWSQRRLCNLFNISDLRPDPMRPNWPDTELLLNYILKNNDITPFLIGKEDNFVRNTDDTIDHCRSITSGKLYSPSYYEKALLWAEDAKQDAIKRIKLWKTQENGENQVGS